MKTESVFHCSLGDNRTSATSTNSSSNRGPVCARAVDFWPSSLWIEKAKAGLDPAMTLLDANTADANKTKNKEIERLLQTHNRQQRKRRDELGRNNKKITVFFFILLFNQNFIQSDDETKEESLKTFAVSCFYLLSIEIRSILFHSGPSPHLIPLVL